MATEIAPSKDKSDKDSHNSTDETWEKISREIHQRPASIPQKEKEQPPESRGADPKLVTQVTHDLHDALHNADVEKLINELEPQSAATRKDISDQYQKEYGHSLEQDLGDKLGRDSREFARAQALLNRKDGQADDVGQVQSALKQIEGAQKGPYSQGPNLLGAILPPLALVDSGSKLWQTLQNKNDGEKGEEELRKTIGSMNSSQTEQLQSDYQKQYGMNLSDTINNNPAISQPTKQALSIMMKGTDKRTTEDTLALAELALHSNNGDMFRQAFQNASPQAREQFRQNGGDAKIDASFGGADRQLAHDYLESGGANLATIINGDTHFYHTNKEAITSAVESASKQDKEQFKRGQQLSQNYTANLSTDDEKALTYYRQVHNALGHAGNNAEIEEWEGKLSESSTDSGKAKPTESTEKQPITAEQIHSSIQDRTLNSASLKQELEKMTPEQKQTLANEYCQKFGSVLSEEVLKNLPNGEKSRFRELLTPQEVCVRQQSLDAEKERDSHGSPLDGALTDLWDYTNVQAQMQNDNLNAFVTQHAGQLSNLTPEQKKEFSQKVDDYNRAEQDYIESKDKAAQAAAEIAVTAAAISTAAISGGGSLALAGATISGIAAGYGARSLVEGSDYDRNNSWKDAVKDGLSGGLIVFGPQCLGMQEALKLPVSAAMNPLFQSTINGTCRVIENVAASNLGQWGSELLTTGLGIDDPKTLGQRMTDSIIPTTIGALSARALYRFGSNFLPGFIGDLGKHTTGQAPVTHHMGPSTIGPLSYDRDSERRSSRKKEEEQLDDE